MPPLARTLSIAAAALALIPCARARADAPLPANFFGMNVNRVLFDDTDPAHTAPLTAARAAGATHGRIDFPWSAVQPNGPRSASYSWTDNAVADLAAQGIEPSPMLGYSALWAASVPGNDKAPPRNVFDYARFAKLMVQRYGPDGSFWRSHPRLPYLPIHRWEVWNEPNLPTFWAGGPNPGLYAGLYLAARAAIKSVDPSAQVIVGGLNSADVGFLSRMYAADPQLHGNVDGVGIHPYAPTVAGVLSMVRAFRAALDAQGETAVPMEVTELGWQRQGHAELTIDESLRAAYTSQVTAILARSDCGIDSLEPYTWQTAERNPADGEDWYGMWSPSAGLLPSGQAFASTVAAFASPDARAAARSSLEIHICHPLPAPPQQLSLRVRSAGSRVRLQVMAGRRPVPGAGVLVQLERGNSGHWVGLVAGAHGYAYLRAPRSATRFAAAAGASGFTSSPLEWRTLRRRTRHKLPRR